jgi:hypothetical protein
MSKNQQKSGHDHKAMNDQFIASIVHLLEKHRPANIWTLSEALQLDIDKEIKHCITETNSASGPPLSSGGGCCLWYGILLHLAFAKYFNEPQLLSHLPVNYREVVDDCCCL